MGILHGLADLQEQAQTRFDAQFFTVAVLGDGHALDILHHKIGTTGLRGAGIMYRGDVRMIQQGQGLALGLEPGNDLPGVHTGFDDLQCHAPCHRRALLSQVHNAAAALAEHTDELIPIDLAAYSRYTGIAIQGGVGLLAVRHITVLHRVTWLLWAAPSCSTP